MLQVSLSLNSVTHARVHKHKVTRIGGDDDLHVGRRKKGLARVPSLCQPGVTTFQRSFRSGIGVKSGAAEAAGGEGGRAARSGTSSATFGLGVAERFSGLGDHRKGSVDPVCCCQELFLPSKWHC